MTSKTRLSLAVVVAGCILMISRYAEAAGEKDGKLTPAAGKIELKDGKGEIKGKQLGAIETLRATLLLLLRKRFKRVPRKVEARIAAETNLHDLNTWTANFANATTLAEVGIPTD